MKSPVANEVNLESSEIPSLLIPMGTTKIVLPTVSVAEMIPYQAPSIRQEWAGEIPDWYLGSVTWRGVSVPMVSYEILNGDLMANVMPDSQLVILNNTGVSQELPFVAIATQGIPRLSRIAVNEITENADLVPKEYDQMVVFIAGEQAVIPDLSKIEEVCAHLLMQQ